MAPRSEGTNHDPWRIAEGWYDTGGCWHTTPEATRTELRDAMGAMELSGNPPPETPTWFVTSGDGPALVSPGTVVLEGGSQVQFSDRLDPDLPLGAHRLVPDDGGPTTNLFVVPPAQNGPGRSWGWAVQLYAARSRSSWGHGDLGDLASLAGWGHGMGADLVAHNPLGAPLPLAKQQPSPYFPSSRRFLSPLYLRIEDVAGADAVGEPIAAAARAGCRLNGEREIDRDLVYRLKLDSLERIWSVVRSSPGVRASLEEARNDVDLTRHGLFNALCERYGSGWRQWPVAMRDPDGAAVDQFGESNLDRVDFWRWVNLELEAQHADAGATGAGLIGDLAVGFDPDGSDAWQDQDLLAFDCSIGAPGDDFNPDGQDWGLPPYAPWKLRAAGYQPWLRTLRRSLRHCAALRIDHVMGLFRLFWIPESRSGAYVYQYGTELLDLALMEAARAGAWLAGEDLGTVEPEVRTAMRDRGVLGYSVAWFEDADPEQWPSDSIGSMTTHDLPTIAGLVTGQDAIARQVAGMGPDPEADEQMLDRLDRLAPDASEVDTIIISAHETLAQAGSRVVLASIDDAQHVVNRPNLPGTTSEHPNWSLALPEPIEAMDQTLATGIAEAMERHR